MAKRLDACAEGVTLEGKSSPRKRTLRSQDITPKQLDIFFDMLADSCNFTLSARKAGFSPPWAYHQRRKRRIRAHDAEVIGK